MKRRYPYIFIISALMLVITSTAAAVMLYKYDSGKFIACISMTAVTAAALITEFFIAEKNSLKFIAKLNESVGTAENEVLYSFYDSSVIVDENFKVLWCNHKFSEEIIPEYEIFAEDICRFIDIDLKELMINNEVNVFCNDKYFKVSIFITHRSGKKLIFLTFCDITDYVELYNKYHDTRPSVLHIVIDNYEDILHNFKESEKAQVAAAVETMLEDFISQTTGILRKLGNDKFIAVIEEQHLNAIIDSKFEILDKARNINIGENKNIITLSIGVGQGAETLEDSERFARDALDMCHGRGGDQAAVKTENGYKFFGGIANGVEKKSRAKSRIISGNLQEHIHKSDGVFIMGHRFADLDAVGAGTALANAARQLGKDAYFVVDYKQCVAKELVEKIREDSVDLLITPKQALEAFTDRSLLIIVDTHNAQLVESRELYEMAQNYQNKIVVIDHHRQSVNYIEDAVIFYVEPYSSSASELVTEIIQYFKSVISIPKVYAEALLAGIILDTKSFVMKTGVRTFEAAAYLRKNGADTVSVKALFANSFESYIYKSKLIASAEIFDRFAIAVADTETADIKIHAPQAADELLGIKNVDASFVVFPTDNTINISARSRGTMNVQVIMERLGGGGHQTMAATQIKGISLSDAKNMLIEVLNQN
ncbi:MAG: DHH family phosphoesterase [Clostridium sp.]|nr:DHH family phosphoesterase [Clostridium sp.]MCM1548108.1 DHH family phosphoesterase [Ruminococcus sp.]